MEFQRRFSQSGAVQAAFWSWNCTALFDTAREKVLLHPAYRVIITIIIVTKKLGFVVSYESCFLLFYRRFLPMSLTAKRFIEAFVTSS